MFNYNKNHLFKLYIAGDLAFVTYAHHALLQGDRKGAIRGTLITVVLAIIFTALQGYEYAQAPFTIADSVFGSAFFCSTGLHGLINIAPIKFLNLISQQQKASLKSNSIYYNSNLSNHRINLNFKKGLRLFIPLGTVGLFQFAVNQSGL